MLPIRSGNPDVGPDPDIFAIIGSRNGLFFIKLCVFNTSCDVTLACDDNRYESHKSIISSRFPYCFA